MEFPEFPVNEGVQILLSETEQALEVVEHLSTSGVTDAEIIVPASDADRVRQNFPLNSKLAELVDRNDTVVSSTEATPLPTVVLTDSRVYDLVRLGSAEVFVEASRDDPGANLEAELSRISGSAEPIEVDILPWSDLLTELEEMVSPEARREFERLIAAARIENLGALDDISVAVVAAAQSGALLNDLSAWAEAVGLASKATFSRRKTALEEKGIVYTEKVPIDVGRPKLRLQLADDISSVRITDDELDVERDDARSRPSATDKSGRNSGTGKEPTDNSASEDEETILTNIEREVRDVITLD